MKFRSLNPKLDSRLFPAWQPCCVAPGVPVDLSLTPVRSSFQGQAILLLQRVGGRGGEQEEVQDQDQATGV